MHHALRVREGEPVEDLVHHRELVLEQRRLSGGEQLAQVLALEQLHDHVGHAALLAEVEHSDDVGVIEIGGGLLASRRKRSRAVSSSLSLPSTTLIATSRPSTGSCARNTSPMAPAPIFSTTLYLPTSEDSMRGRVDRTMRASKAPETRVVRAL